MDRPLLTQKDTKEILNFSVSSHQFPANWIFTGPILIFGVWVCKISLLAQFELVFIWLLYS